MPRSVSHTFEGDLSGVALRVWERRAEGSMHAIVEGRYLHRCGQGVEHPIEVEARWDIPSGADPWHDLALRARDRETAAARDLASSVVAEAVADSWVDPCPR